MTVGNRPKEDGEMSVEEWLELMQSFTVDSARDLAIAKRLMRAIADANSWVAAASTILSLLAADRIRHLK